MIVFQEIGVIRSPHKDREGAPIQPTGADAFKGHIEIFPRFKEGLADLEGFERIILLYHFHLSQGFSLKPKPFLDNTPRGVFSTRAPKRPNSIGLSIVNLLEVTDNIIQVSNIDVVDKTPLIDIKPYVPKFDAHPESRAGWLDKSAGSPVECRADRRFLD